jgi:gas vesicle protein
MKKSFIKGTLLGVIAGAVAGILLAPKSGKETQDDLKRIVKETTGDLKLRVDGLTKELGTRVDDLTIVAKDLKGEAKDESQELIKRADVFRQDLRIAGSNLAKDGAQVKDSVSKNLKPLLAEAADIAKELERFTKQLSASAKKKLTSTDAD